MRFLVTGSSGLIGRQVVKDLAKLDNQVYSCYHDSKPEFGILKQMDLTNSENISKIMNNVNPEVVIHLAAMTNVDLCETEKELASLINTKATEILSKQAARRNAFMLYVSTDYVFDGKKGMKKETDASNPIDFYGKSKLEGEKSVIEFSRKWSIARTSTPFGIHPTKITFPSWVIQNLRAKKVTPVIVDQYTSPTYVPNLSRMIIELAIKQIEGVIHLAGSTRISRYKMAELLVEKLELDATLLKSVSINDMNWVAKRPEDSSLDVSKALSILKEKPLPIDKTLDSFTQEVKIA